MTPENLIDELEDALSAKTLARRADVLRRVTDIFLGGSGKFGGEQIEFFDEVMSRLVRTVEVAARAQFGSRIADAADAPHNVVRLLAFDTSIEVAEPVLARSDRLSEDDLVQNAETMSQEHLLAISRRKELRERLTDVLVTRGNREVLVSTSNNVGSHFSSKGLATLVDKAEKDDQLALSLWSRSDIPRQEMVRLFRNASEGLRLQLEAADPRHAGAIRSAVFAATDRIQSIARDESSEFRSAREALNDLHAKGLLNESVLRKLLKEGRFDPVVVALSLICNLPVGLIERALVQGRREQIVLIAKAADFDWSTTLALIRFQSTSTELSQEEIDESRASYERMRSKTARTALDFYRLREAANQVKERRDSHVGGLGVSS